MSGIFKASVIIGISFGINKLLGLARQYFIARQFGFSAEIDAFNVANNMPDLIFSLFAGGALAMAFIPVFAEYIDVEGRDHSWKLFSKVASLLFIFTALTSLLVAILAPVLVSSPIGVAPGFSAAQQELVVSLLRINLFATLLFSLSGLVTASLQAHKHFLLPAIAPIFYNLGIVFGAIVLAPVLGIYGLMYGVVIGALLHLAVQIPGLIRYKFRFTFVFDIHDTGIRKILRLMGPRILTVLLIQITFLLRDNFASRLAPGSVTALTYGYFIMQVPETLIGTSIAIALLPSLSEFISKKRHAEFARTLSIAIRTLIVASLLSMALVFAVLGTLITSIFDFSPENTQLLVRTTHAFMAGLIAHTLMEILVRAFYARQEAAIPLYATLLRTTLFVGLGAIFYRQTGVVGLAAIDSLTVAIEAVYLLVLLWPVLIEKKEIFSSFARGMAGSFAAGAIAWFAVMVLQTHWVIQIGVAVLIATAAYALFVVKEAKMVMKL